METESRTKNVFKNMKIGLICQMILLAMSFISRTIFVRTLGAEYLGISGLFTNILTVLSFAELGIGDAVIFSMYKPIAEDDKNKIASLVELYRKMYTYVGMFVLSAGIIVAPFLKYIIKEELEIPENLTLIYLLFVFNVSLSYFFVYRQSIITAHQKGYVVSTYQMICTLIVNISQIVELILLKNYILFLIIQIVGTLLCNYMLARKSKKMYPYTCTKQKYNIPQIEVKRILSDIKSLFVYKIGSVILNGTDNILISSLIGVSVVGLSSNYFLITSAFETVMNKIKGAFVASIGNLNVEADNQKKESIFYKVFLFIEWLYGLLAIGFLLLGNEVIELWLGDKYKLPFLAVIAISINLYVTGVHYTAYTYRTTLGLFKEGQLAPIIAATVNLCLSIVLAKPLGVAGIFIATPIARMVGMGVIDPILIYKKAFKAKPIKYYIMYVKGVIINVSITLLCYFILNQMNSTSIVWLLIKIMVIFAIYNSIKAIINMNNNSFKELLILVFKKIGVKTNA